jgi:hypothetical protein
MTQRAPATAAPASTPARPPTGSRESRPAARNATVAATDLDVAMPRVGSVVANDDSPPAAQAGVHFACLANHPAGATVFDDDALRAQLTRLLIESLAPHLGLDPKRIVVHADAAARGPLGVGNAVGLQRDGTLFLDPARYRPDRDSGRYLLAHELAHAAQRYGNGAAGAAPAAIEADAHRIARALVRRQPVPRPTAGLAPGAAAALSASEVEAAADVTAALPEAKVLEPEDARQALDALVAQTHQAELARIIELLSYGVFDWAITDSDVTAVLRVLMTVPMVSARALVTALPWKYRRRLLENLDTRHYRGHREQVLAAWWGCTAAELKPYAEELRKAFEAMDLRRFESLEAAAAQYALRSMGEAQRRQLLGGDKRDEIETLMAFVPDARAEARAMVSALKEEQKLHSERAAAESAFSGGPRAAALKALVKLIVDMVERRNFRGDDAISVLRMLMPYVLRKAELRAIADHLAGVKVIVSDDPKEKPEYEERRDYLEQLIRRVPVRALYASGGLERVFFLLLSFRPPFKNAELAAEKTDESRFKLIDLLMTVLADPFVDRVTSEDAYFAFLLVKAMPAEARRAFFDVDHGARWTLVMNKMSQQQRESAALNLYGGGPAGADRDALLSQLLAEDVWAPGGAARLDALIRMAIAAGEHAYVFNLSEDRQAHSKPWLRPLVDKYRLFDPDAIGPDGKPRTRHSREILKGTPWYTGGWLFGNVHMAAKGLGFVFGSENVEIATTSIGGEGLNLVKLQQMFGGNFLGARFSERYKYERGKSGAADRGVNFANVKWDTRLGVLTMQSPELQIDAIRYPIEDFTFQTGAGSAIGLDVALAYSTAKKPEPSRIDLTLRKLTLNDVALIAADRMKSINRVDLGMLAVHAGSPSAAGTSPRAPRGGLKVPVPLVGIPLGGAWNLFLGSLWNGLFGLLKKGTFGLVDVQPKAGLSGSVTELTDNLLAADQPMGFSLAIGSMAIRGLSTSAGQFIESVTLDDLVLAGGGDAASYRRALTESLARIDKRLAAARDGFGRAGDDRRDALSKQIRALLQQKAHTEDELEQLKRNEAEVKQLEALQKTAPRAFSGAQRLRLRRLKAQLSGAVLDVGRVSLKGLEGVSGGEFTLDGVHGSGRSVDSALSLLMNGDKLKNFITGAEGRPILEDARDDPDRFVLDIAHAELPAVEIRGALPTAGAAAKDHASFLAKHEPWRPSHVAELERLAKRKALAERRDALLADPGIVEMDAGQRKEFGELTRALEAIEAAGALTIGKIVVDGAALTLSARQIGVEAEALRIDDLRRGSFRVARIEGSHVQVGVDIRGGIAGLDDWRGNLLGLGIKGESVGAFGITQQDLGLSVDRATLMGIDDASLAVGERNASARIVTKLILVEGVRLAQSGEMLLRERDHLRGLAQSSAKQQKRLASVEAALASLDKLRSELADSEIAVAKARTPKQTAAARQRRDTAQQQLDRWAERLVAGSLAVNDLDVGVTQLGDVLSPAYDPSAAAPLLQGKGGASGKRIFSGVAGTDLRIPGLSAGRVALGEAGGSVQKTPAGTKVAGIRIDSIALDRIDWRDGQRHVFASGPTMLQGIDVDAFIGEEQTVVSRLDVAAVSAEQLGYEDEATGLRVGVQSGALAGIHVTNLTLGAVKDVPGKEKTRLTGDVKVDSLSDVKLDALVGGLRARGTLHGSNLSVSFVSDRQRILRIGDLGLDQGRLTRPGTWSRIDVSFRGLRGAVTEDVLDSGETRFALQDIALDDFTIGRSLWLGSGASIAIDGHASLKGVTLDAIALQSRPGADGKPGEIKSFKITRLAVAQTSASKLHLHLDAAAPKSPGDPGSPEREIDLESATILGLEVSGFDLASELGKGAGKVNVHDSLQVDKLRLAIGGAAKDKIVTTLSVKAFGAGAKEEGLRGRELSAEIYGPGRFKVKVGTIKEIRGEFEGLGARAAFATGKVTMAPVDIDGNTNEIKVSDVEVHDIGLTNARYADGKGTEIGLDSAFVTTLKLKNITATFGEVTDAAGKTSEGLTKLAVSGVDIDHVAADGFKFSGVSTLAAGGTKSRQITAQRAELAGFTLDELSQDFVGKVTRIKNARLGKTSITGFAATFAETLAGKTSQTELLGDIACGAMHADLTLTGTKVGAAEGLSIDGVFELTDPAKGLGLSNLKVVQKEGGKPTFELASDYLGRAGGIDLTGLKVHFAPDGSLHVAFDELANRNLKLKAGDAEVGFELASLKNAAVEIEGLKPGAALKLIGATLDELKVKGLVVNMDVEKGGAAAGAGGAKRAPSVWVLDALAGLEGKVHVKANRVPVATTAEMDVPIRNGTIDFDHVAAETPVGRIPFGIDHKGIYAQHLYKTHLYEKSPISGATLEVVESSGVMSGEPKIHVVSRGSLALKPFLEGTLNEASSDDAGSGGTPKSLSALNDLVLDADLQMGEGNVGNQTFGVTLGGKALGKNRITISQARIGRDLTLRLPGVPGEQEPDRSARKDAGDRPDRREHRARPLAPRRLEEHQRVPEIQGVPDGRERHGAQRAVRQRFDGDRRGQARESRSRQALGGTEHVVVERLQEQPAAARTPRGVVRTSAGRRSRCRHAVASSRTDVLRGAARRRFQRGAGARRPRCRDLGRRARREGVRGRRQSGVRGRPLSPRHHRRPQAARARAGARRAAAPGRHSFAGVGGVPRTQCGADGRLRRQRRCRRARRVAAGPVLRPR